MFPENYFNNEFTIDGTWHTSLSFKGMNFHLTFNKTKIENFFLLNVKIVLGQTKFDLN